MRFEKKETRKKKNSKKKKIEDSFAIKFKKIILTAILKKKLHIMRKFFQRKLTKSVNAKKIYKSQSKQFTSFKSQR